MDIIKPYSRRSLLWILVFMVLLTGTLAVTLFLGKAQLSQNLLQTATPEAVPAQLADQFARLLDTYAVYLISLFIGVSILFGIALWLVLRSAAKNTIASMGDGKSRTKKAHAPTEKEKDDTRIKRNERLFLHMLTVLQREGRLVDFLQEDLDMYEDEQIGAAVRDIHINCRKILNKNLSMTPIITGNEGEAFTVESGFDPDAIKLTGRVTGQPPFQGIIRHKGWRAQKLDLPDLSATKAPAIISPAEVEIE